MNELQELRERKEFLVGKLVDVPAAQSAYAPDGSKFSYYEDKYYTWSEELQQVNRRIEELGGIICLEDLLVTIEPQDEVSKMVTTADMLKARASILSQRELRSYVDPFYQLGSVLFQGPEAGDLHSRVFEKRASTAGGRDYLGRSVIRKEKLPAALKRKVSSWRLSMIFRLSKDHRDFDLKLCRKGHKKYVQTILRGYCKYVYYEGVPLQLVRDNRGVLCIWDWDFSLGHAKIMRKGSWQMYEGNISSHVVKYYEPPEMLYPAMSELLELEICNEV